MILHACWQGNHHSRKPVLVWLHGFLGSNADWLPVQAAFSDWPQLSVDLPGHGGSQAQPTTGFDALSASLNATLRVHRVQRYWLIGYSLGGRVALYHACRHALPGLMGLVVEGGHYGLALAEQRTRRLAHDGRWASRFRHHPLQSTLAAWYQQPVFSDLTASQRVGLIRLRLHNHRAALADMLLATSLGRQPWLLPELHQLRVPLHYFCGEWDSKFQRLAAQASLPCVLIPSAGHNAHRANPAVFADRLAQRLTSQELK
ncbi:2-succinyl-6-hydroxy-2,4-cyclohexadiene-1-carboxylate synthase [Erwinia sp. E_sp_B04_7]|uniref:2-succinyl-6-hydroxy-2, 4-cyclohexadiene-1-carboxylate synthase n=1 Tax=unclassified Erwinia TaxID=2622719 RepID=UPI0030CA5C2F